jgi:hypothetical protein
VNPTMPLLCGTSWSKDSNKLSVPHTPLTRYEQQNLGHKAHIEA